MKKQRMFAHPFSFEGRIRRLEYMLSCLFYYVCMSYLGNVKKIDDLFTFILFYTIIVIMVWFSLAQGAKRCHDNGEPGWLQIIPFYVIFMLFGDSNDYENRYGKAPKGRE